MNVEETKELVGTGGFEPPTPRTPSECSTRLSHVPTAEKKACDRRRPGSLQYFTPPPRWLQTQSTSGSNQTQALALLGTALTQARVLPRDLVAGVLQAMHF